MAAWDEMEECFSARCNWEWSRRSEAERSDMGPGRGASSSFFSFWGRGKGGWWLGLLEALQGRAGKHLDFVDVLFLQYLCGRCKVYSNSEEL